MLRKRRIFNKSLNIYSLKVKMFLTILICFIFIVVFTVVNNIFAIQIIRKKTNNSVIRTAEQTHRYLSFLFNKARNIAYITSVNKNLENISRYGVFDGPGYYDFYLAIHDLYEFSLHQTEFNGEIQSMYIYIDRGQYFIDSQQGIYSYMNIKDSIWLKMALSAKSTQQWIAHYYDRDFSQSNLISLMYRADLVNRKIQTPVYISINFLERDILDVLRGMKVTPNSMVYFIDGIHQILVTDDKSNIGKPLEDIVDIELSSLEKAQSMRVKMGKREYYQAIYIKDAVTNGGIVVLIPERELLAEQRSIWLFLIIVISLTVIIFIGFGIKMVIDYVDKPVSKLVSFMRKAEQGEFEERIQDDRKDEFGYLYASYNRMVGRIKRLIEELYQERLLKSEMEVKVLQEQINPHFLYNTLDTVNWIAKTNNVDSISKIVISLSNMYRITFNKGRDYIRISEMIQGIKCYLDIQKIRYGDAFDYYLDIDNEVKEYWVINLILQTVVENAIIHGIDDSAQGGLIKIKALKDEDKIHFIVQDNGKGMTKEKLGLINAIINADNVASQSGLCNVQKRLQLLYGNEYGLHIDSREGEGTQVDIFLPIIKKASQDDEDANGKEPYYD